MSDTRKSNKSPLQSLDPQPIRTPSPSRDRDRERDRRDRAFDRGPERAKSYPGPESQYGPQPYGPQNYNPQDYANQSYNPQNYDSPGYNQPYNPQNYPPVSGPQTGPGNLPIRPASESYLPNHAGAMATASAQQMVPATAPSDLRELQALRVNCQFNLREYMSLQRQRRGGDSAVSAYELETRIRNQTNMVLNDLRILQGEVRSIAKEAENHRWRRWIIGGAIATFIPFIRRFWRRNDDDEDSHSSANDTEYAFKKSKGLLEHIKNGILGKGRFAKLAFFVFAVLVVFSNEVSIRVARTVQKRLKKLTARIEHGDPDIDEKDMKLLEGWRWRVLLWWKKHKTDFFNDPECVMQLTKSLLKLDFGLKLELPDDRLCPPVLNRHNYLMWLKGLLDSTSYEKQDRKIVGLDIGTGASCIYPLMGCTERDWDFIATDIDPKSLEYARKNVALNGLDSRIKVVERKPTDVLISLDDLNVNSISFTMSNPPFYKSEEELLESAKQKSRPPFTACTGAKVEMVTDGGEVEFVDRMLKESLALQERVQWYTSMFGFLTSLIEFVDKLRDHKIDNYAVTEFIQGSKTRRWAVAWSFGNMRPAQSVARGIKTAVSKNVLPEITEERVVDIPLQEKIGDFADRFRSELEKLDLITWEWDTERLEGIGRAAGRVWARAWRRRKQRGGAEDQKVVDVKCEFAFKVSIRVGKDDVAVHCRWLEGHNPVTFESFRGYLKKTARSNINRQSTENKA
ncbi:hypothetical protein FOXB_07305 [Fusarium oxysporum f. sp. conglutinans Fo5176]|uniref:23S rRNA (-N6)-methyltransferase n=14 Tax=Fusarium oxysporum TaxID=5507 RepID=F9FLM5_FUSOF|nr:hypothetical protein FOXB_07305 [Fusarium oxysporum f. sp. conglutinans Fo5176]